jgi:hypothetical protein
VQPCSGTGSQLDWNFGSLDGDGVCRCHVGPEQQAVFFFVKRQVVGCGQDENVKMVRIFSDRIRDRIRLEGFRSDRIRIWIFNIRYRICIRIPKSHIYNVDIQLYLIRHG